MTGAEDGDDPLRELRERIREPRNLSLRQIANRSGLPVAELRQVYAALGISDDELHGEGAVAEAAALRAAREVLPLEALVRLARARRMAATQVAAADVAAVRDELLAPLRDTDVDVPATLAHSAAALWPISTALFVNAHHRAVERLVSLSVAADAVRDPGRGVDLAVGFVDVVGYTRFSAVLAPDGLADALDAFEEHVLAVSATHDEVTIPKFIGDAAMIVATEPVLLAETLLEIIEPAAGLDDIPLRAGMSAGETLVRGGDYFGQPVNMAARLTDYARPHSVLADAGLREALESRFELRRIPRVRLQGIGSHRPLVVRALLTGVEPP